jgi:hypothetical protein
MKRKSYPTDLTDAQWRRISQWGPEPIPGGRPAKYERPEVIFDTKATSRFENAVIESPPRVVTSARWPLFAAICVTDCRQ